MSTASAYLTIRGISVDVVYKDIKNLHIGVYPPMGRVRVAAPPRLDDEQVRLAVIQRLPWIKRQRQQLQDATRQSEREMVTGETHYVWGVRHRLKIIERPGRPHLEVDGDRLLIYVSEGTDTATRQALLDRWYRHELRLTIPDLIARWEPRLDISVSRWSIRRMKTKWGSCNRQTGHIWINVELAKKHPASLEYIAVHEMTHYLERNHGKRFITLMDGFMPDWRSRRDELNDAPLGPALSKSDAPSEQAVRFYDRVMERLKELTSSMRRSVFGLLLIAAVIELLDLATISNVQLGPFQFSDIKLVHKLLPVVACYLIYDIWLTVIRYAYPKRVATEFDRIHQPATASSPFMGLTYPSAPSILVPL